MVAPHPHRLPQPGAAAAADELESGPGAAGRVALYRGPILLAYDERDNRWPVESIPALGEGPFEVAVVDSGDGRPGTMLTAKVSTGQTEVTLCDFATAGMPKVAPVAAPDVVGKVFSSGAPALIGP